MTNISRSAAEARPIRVLDTRPETGGGNLQYGLFAGKLAEAMGVEVDGELVYLLSTLHREVEVADGEVRLVHAARVAGRA